MLFNILITVVILQRMTELIVAKTNEAALLKKGAVEYGRSHYKYILILHVCFFLSLIAENWFFPQQQMGILNYAFLVIFILLQAARVWVITTLGKFWTTRIIRLPKAPLIKSGPYKFAKHPNYIIVALEFFTLPLIFDLYLTAIVFTVLNAIILNIRIKEEDKALAE